MNDWNSGQSESPATMPAAPRRVVLPTDTFGRQAAALTRQANARVASKVAVGFSSAT